MIFGVAVKEPKLFLMLSEKDIQGMREGQTRFVDERATQGATFNGVIVSLHKTDQEALALMQRFSIPGSLATHEPQGEEVRCERCKGIMRFEQLFEGKCDTCWAALAKAK